jgi:hypothetical protein
LFFWGAALVEFIRNNEEVYIIVYCFIIFWINISYFKDFKKIKEGLNTISSEDELEVNPHSLSLLLLVLIFNFFRRWLIYLLAVLITDNIFVLLISAILFVIGLYDSLFNYSLEKVKKSNIQLYLAIIDSIFISIFIIYLFVR